MKIAPVLLIKRCIYFVMLLTGAMHAQKNVTVSGFITEEGSRENLPGVIIYQKNTNFATTSNAYGFYSLSLPPCDTAEIIFSMIGYRQIIHRLKLRKDTTLQINLSQGQAIEVTVTTNRKESISQDVQMSTIDIPVEKIKQIPALFGEKDALKVLQLLPGVQKSGEGSSGFYVRGGGQDQNLIILDDATVYNAFHLFGFFSLFNGDAIKSIELIKGGFPARYGGRLSSVLDIQMKDGSKEKIKGEAGVGLISSRFTLEGPIIKDKCSFLISARRTYIDALIYPFMPSTTKGGYYFYDMTAKVNYVLGQKDRLYLSGYFGQDKFYFNVKSGSATTSGGLDWGNATGTARWNHVFSSRLFANTSLIFTNYVMRIKNEMKDDFGSFSLLYNSGIRDYSIKTSFDFLPNPQHYIRFGIHGIYHRFTPGAMTIKGSFISEEIKSKSLLESFENAAYIEDDWKINKVLRINTGGRVSVFTLKNTTYVNPEPRLSVRYLSPKDIAIKASYALMNQYMHLLSNTGIGLPTDLWVPATTKARYMTSQQVAMGVTKDFVEKDIDISIEGYYKEMKNVLSYKEGASFFTVQGENGTPRSWEDNVTSGRGWSYGSEFLIRKKEGKFSGWIGYTLSWTQLQFDALNFGKKFYARYDRRHDISVVAIYKHSEKWTFSATWVYGTGNAITLPLNRYSVNNYSSPLTGISISNQGFVGEVQDYGQQRNAYRMSPYHRLDLGVQYTSKVNNKINKTFEFSIYNAYNRYNPFFYFIETDQNGDQKLMQITLFPILPSVSWTWKF